MKFAYNIKLSTYRQLIKRGLSTKRMRASNFSDSDFSYIPNSDRYKSFALEAKNKQIKKLQGDL